jgi:hypothetical protein
MQCVPSAFAQDVLFPIQVGDKWGYIDKEGKVIVQPAFTVAKPFANGMGMVREWSSFGIFGNRKFGYVDSSGTVVIKPQFSDADDFADGLALVTTEGVGRSSERVFIDKTGKIIISAQNGIGYTGRFSEGLATVRTDQGRGYMNKSGQVVLRVPYTNAYEFSDGVALVSNGETPTRMFDPDNQERAFIDPTGKLLFPLRRKEDFDYFSQGLAGFVCTDFFCSGAGFIDKTGAVKIKLTGGWRPVTKFSQGLAGITKGIDNTFRYAFIDNTGRTKFQIPGAQGGEPFSTFSAFSEDMTFVKVGGKFGYVDTTGTMRIQPQFDKAEKFSGGLAKVTTGTTWGYINKNGVFVWKSQ